MVTRETFFSSARSYKEFGNILIPIAAEIGKLSVIVRGNAYMVVRHEGHSVYQNGRNVRMLTRFYLLHYSRSLFPNEISAIAIYSCGTKRGGVPKKMPDEIFEQFKQRELL